MFILIVSKGGDACSSNLLVLETGLENEVKPEVSLCTIVCASFSNAVFSRITYGAFVFRTNGVGRWNDVAKEMYLWID